MASRLPPSDQSGSQLLPDEKHDFDALAFELDAALLPHRSFPSQHFADDAFRSVGANPDDHAFLHEATVYRSVGSAAVADMGMSSYGAEPAPTFGVKSLDMSRLNPMGLSSMGLNPKALDVHDIAAQLQVASIETSPPARPAGNYLEPNHHFYCTRTKSPQELMTTLKHALLEMDVDFTEVKKDYQLRCAAYDVAMEIPFLCSVYTSPNDDNQFVVEVQRRSGDAIFFCSIYRSILSHMVADKAAEASCLPATRKAFVPPALPPSLDAEEENAAFRDSVRILLNMCASPYVDVKLEGLYALARLTSEEDKRCFIVQDSSFHVLISGLHDANENVHRACLTSLANVCSTEDGPCQAVHSSARSRLLHLATSPTKQVMRESVRLLAAVAQHLGQSAYAEDTVMVARRLAHFDDARTKRSAERILAVFKRS